MYRFNLNGDGICIWPSTTQFQIYNQATCVECTSTSDLSWHNRMMNLTTCMISSCSPLHSAACSWPQPLLHHQWCKRTRFPPCQLAFMATFPRYSCNPCTDGTGSPCYQWERSDDKATTYLIGSWVWRLWYMEQCSVTASKKKPTLLKMGCSKTPLGHYALLVIKKDQRLLLITRRA